MLKSILLKTTNRNLHSVEWPIPKVVAFTTTRHLPSSELVIEKDLFTASHSDPYSAFNLGDHVGDSSKRVSKNRKLLQDECLSSQLTNSNLHSVNFISPKVQWLKQVHEAGVVNVSTYSEIPYTADAAVTQVPNLALAVMTADCLPILLSNKEGTEIAAIHGGWRPLAKNIIANTLLAMTSSPKNIYAWLGPCISQKIFEVGHEVKKAFIKQDIAFNKAFIHSHRKGYFLADLHEIARIQLINVGINEISSLAHCTYQNKQSYFSYRRDGITGRMASVAMITNK